MDRYYADLEALVNRIDGAREMFNFFKKPQPDALLKMSAGCWIDPSIITGISYTANNHSIVITTTDANNTYTIAAKSDIEPARIQDSIDATCQAINNSRCNTNMVKEPMKKGTKKQKM